jgi:hypothetical protein
MGQMEMNCIFDIGKKNYIFAKATQVSDVAHGPLVLLKSLSSMITNTRRFLCVWKFQNTLQKIPYS